MDDQAGSPSAAFGPCLNIIFAPQTFTAVKTAETEALFRKFEGITALVVGDAMVDIYLYGKAGRNSPEAPVPVVTISARERRLGGAANVALNLRSMGVNTLLYAVAGDDDEGSHLKKMLHDNHLPHEGLFTGPGRVTTSKSRIITGGQQMARIDEETTCPLEPDLELILLKAIFRAVEQQKADLILFVDYDKGVITPGLFRQIRDLAINRGILTAVDPKKRLFGEYENVDLFKPNFKEFCDGTGICLHQEDTINLQILAEKYRKEKSFRHLMVTRSEHGILMTGEHPPVTVPAYTRLVADVSGAGDTVISLASLCLASGASPEWAARISNTAGGLVCRQAGVTAVDRNLLLQELTRSASLQPC